MADNRFKAKLENRAKELGFDLCRITSATLPDETGKRLEAAIRQNHHGTMQWMENTFERRKSPDSMWKEAKSAILLGMNYGPQSNPMETLAKTEKATISVYARNRDYHDVIKGKLKTLAGWVASQKETDVKVFVDTAPLMEKPLAEQAGLGWQGKHTNLVSREFGSWVFLGSILTDAELEPDESEPDHCGSCRACLDICPTNAFPAPYQLDARKCISYLTIEHAGPIPVQYRKALGNRIYGCDDCLAVCPWNKYAKQANETKLQARDDLVAPTLAELAQLDDARFRRKFSGSPIKRIGRDRFMRNVLTAIGNSGSAKLISPVLSHLDDPNPMVRGAAVWALRRLEESQGFADMRDKALKSEVDETVREEWNRN
ncbi:MAG: tRNA epoxyqueuosine(34) reductase QueG [Pseudomonadota bacterium]